MQHGNTLQWGWKSNIDEIPEITLHNVSFQYGDKVILQGINYSFHAGCKYAVMGESGSGKTTLTKIILGLLPGYTGDIRYGQVEHGSYKKVPLGGFCKFSA